MHRSVLLPAIALSSLLNAQYGTFDKQAVAAAKAGTTVVVMDAGNTPWNAAMLDAAKADWRFTADPELGTTMADLAQAPLDPAKTYLMKVRRTDPEKHDATFLALVQGWKMKKNEKLEVADNAVTNVPMAQELAWVMIDPAVVGSNGALLKVYVKCLQDYLKHVEDGSITDKTTADRLYESRNRLVKDMELWVAKEQLDKSLPDLAAIKMTYTHPVKLMDMGQLMAAVAKGQTGVCITDVVITGAYKTKWCFRRVFNAATGELMYQRDEAALYDKKMGFIKEDFRVLEQSR